MSALRPLTSASRRSRADMLDRPLGAARTQIHETYIVSQTRDGLSWSISMPPMSASSMKG